MDESRVLATGLIIYFVVLVLYILPQVAIFWKLYSKAGRPGWSAVIPVYSIMVMADIAEKPAWTGIVGGLFWVFAALRSFIAVPLLGVGRLITAIVSLYVLNAFIKKYDRGLGYWALVVFLPIIAIFITDKSSFKGDETGPVVAQSGMPSVSQSPTQEISAVTPTQPTVAPTVGQSVQPTTPVAPESNVKPPIPPQAPTDV